MKKSFKYGFTTCTLAYLLIVIPLLVLFATLFRGSYSPIVNVRGMLSFLTLMLSDFLYYGGEFSWWGDFYYLAPLVPWLASSCVLTLLIYRFNGGARRRVLFSGFSIFVYYFAMWLVFIIHGLIYGWGDIAYDLIWLWPLFGFGFGYAAATLVERIRRKLYVVKGGNQHEAENSGGLNSDSAGPRII